MSTEANKALLRRAIDEVYSHGHLESIDDFLVDDVIAHQPEGDLRGLEEFTRGAKSYLSAFPDHSMVVEDLLGEGDEVMLRYSYRGTHTGETEALGPPTGEQMAIDGITLYRFQEGKVAEMWDRYDTRPATEGSGDGGSGAAPTERVGAERSRATPGDPTSIEEHMALLRRVVDEVYGQGRLDIADELLRDDVIAHESDGDVHGIEEFKRLVAPYLAAYPGLTITWEDVVAEGDKVGIRYTDRAIHTGATDALGPPTGQEITIEGIAIYRFEGGKVAEVWNHYKNQAV